MVKKLLLFTTSLLFISTFALKAQSADTTYWTKKGIVGLSLTQVSLSNWSAGGDGSISFDALFNYSADYARDKHIWENRIELGYGLSNTSSKGTQKTNDRVYLSSNYGYKIAKSWYFGAMLTFQTQFAKGYDYSIKPKSCISRLMSPGYLTIGPTFTWKPKTWFTAMLSPAAWRGTFVLDKELSDAGAFGVDRGEHLLSELGANATLEINYEFIKNMTLLTRLNLYSNYLDRPKNVDVRWDVLINMKINRWFSANFSFNMIYDDDVKIASKSGRVSPRLQIKESLGVGFQAMF